MNIVCTTKKTIGKCKSTGIIYYVDNYSLLDIRFNYNNTHKPCSVSIAFYHNDGEDPLIICNTILAFFNTNYARYTNARSFGKKKRLLQKRLLQKLLTGAFLQQGNNI